MVKVKLMGRRLRLGLIDVRRRFNRSFIRVKKLKRLFGQNKLLARHTNLSEMLRAIR